MMKRVVLTILILSLPIPCLAKYSGGGGAPDDPYQIADINDLLELAADTNDYDKCFILIADINMGGQVFTTAIIAPDTSLSDGFQGTAFTGIFDGNGHKITDFSLFGINYPYIGLFGQTDSGCSIRNLGLENFKVKGYFYVGGLVGNNVNGSITNCYSTGQSNGYSQSQYVGGLAGCNGGSISNCYSMGSVNSYIWAGGLVGGNGGSISNCSSTADAVSGSGDSHGFGGLVGVNWGNISNCYSTGTAMGGYSVGGFAGSNSGNIINCHSTGDTNGFYLLIGGFVGQNFSGSISNCFSTGDVSGSLTPQYVGGFVGDNDSGGSIGNCFSTGSVDFSKGVYVGGLAGGNYNSSISNCYSMGFVNGNNYVGGLVGRNWHGSGIINCYSTGQTSGSTNVGGLVGFDNSGGINSSYFLITSGPDNGYGMPLTDEQMKQQSSFIGWVFVGETANGFGDWRLCNEGLQYPKLAWQYLPGDFVCPDGVDILDLVILSDNWLLKPVTFDQAPPGGDGIVNFADFAILADQWNLAPDIDVLDAFADEWLKSAMRADLWPRPNGDGVVNFADFAVLANHWLEGL